MSETTPLIKAALNLRVGVGFDVYIQWDENAMTNVNIDELNGQAVLALIMGAVRAERFCSGALEGFLQNGSIIKWLKRLKKLSDAFEESE